MNPQEIFSIQIYHGYILQLFFAELIFYPLLSPRKGFIFRLPIGLLLYGFLSLITTNVLYHFIQGLSSLTIFLFSLCLSLFLFRSSFFDILFYMVGAQLIQNLSHNLEQLIYLPLKASFTPLGWFFLSFGMCVLLYVSAYFVIVRRLKKVTTTGIKNYGVLLIAVFSALFCYLIQYLLQFYRIDSYWITTLPLIATDSLAIILQFGLVDYNRKIDENLYLEKFIQQSNRYYESVKENIDVLNMKAHDLKHFISNARGKSQIDEEGLAELEKTVSQYELTAKTGNKALDVVITEKSYLCQKEGIRFSLMGKGEYLSFLHVGDLTSLFGNLLSNAIECEVKVKEKEKRFILLRISQKGEMTSIHMENYCPFSVPFRNGLPETDKKDASYHGYGLKSVVYVVKKYGGSVHLTVKDEIFAANILFPGKKNV